MAAVTLKGSIFDTNAGNKTVTATPTAGDLIVIVSASSGAGVTLSCTDDNADGLGTYTQVVGPVTTGANASKHSIFIRDALVGSATSTIFTLAQAGSNGGGGAVYAVAGTTKVGSAAARSVGSQGTQTLGTTPAPVLSKTPLAVNPIITSVHNASNTANVTARSSPAYTRDADLGYSNPTIGLDTAHLDSVETSATITWGGTSATAFSSCAVEIATIETQVIVVQVVD